MPRLSLFALALFLVACGDAQAPPTDVATSTTVAVEPGDPAADATVIESVAAEASAEAAAAPAVTPVAASEPSARPAAPGTPMVEVNTEASVYHATTDARQLRLRGGPSTSSADLGTFSDAFVLECQDLKYDDAWCRVRTDMPTGETVGWAKRRHLSYVGNSWTEDDGVRTFGSADYSGLTRIGGPGPADGFPVDARWDILADDGYANVRATASADAAVVRRLDNRVMTDVVRCDGGAPGKRWCEISSPVRGWVHQSGFHRQLRAY